MFIWAWLWKIFRDINSNSGIPNSVQRIEKTRTSDYRQLNFMRWKL